MYPAKFVVFRQFPGEQRQYVINRERFVISTRLEGAKLFTYKDAQRYIDTVVAEAMIFPDSRYIHIISFAEAKKLDDIVQALES